MKTAQTTLKNSDPEYCEHSKPHDEIFICELTDFGFVRRCTSEDRADCPDLEYFKKQGRAKK